MPSVGFSPGACCFCDTRRDSEPPFCPVPIRFDPVLWPTDRTASAGLERAADNAGDAEVSNEAAEENRASGA